MARQVFWRCWAGLAGRSVSPVVLGLVVVVIAVSFLVSLAIIFVASPSFGGIDRLVDDELLQDVKPAVYVQLCM